MEREEIVALLTELGRRLAAAGLRGEMMVVGGTAMALCFDALRQTKDVDAIFEPKGRIYELAEELAEERGLPSGWLNDAAKSFFPPGRVGERVVLDLPGLVVRAPSAEYLLVMKAFAARPEDLEDVRFLVGYLGLGSLGEVLGVVERYYPRARIPAKTQFFLEEILGGQGAEVQSPRRRDLSCGTGCPERELKRNREQGLAL